MPNKTKPAGPKGRKPKSQPANKTAKEAAKKPKASDDNKKGKIQKAKTVKKQTTTKGKTKGPVKKATPPKKGKKTQDTPKNKKTQKKPETQEDSDDDTKKERKKRKSKPGKNIKKLWMIKSSTGKVFFVKVNHFGSIMKFVLDQRKVSEIEAPINKTKKDGTTETVRKNIVIEKAAKVEIFNRLYLAFSELFKNCEIMKVNRMTKKTGIRLNETDLLSVLNIYNEKCGYMNPAQTIDHLTKSKDLELYLETLLLLLSGRGDMLVKKSKKFEDVSFQDGMLTGNDFAISTMREEFDYRPDKKRPELAKDPLNPKKARVKEPKTEDTSTENAESDDDDDDEDDDDDDDDDDEDDDDDDEDDDDDDDDENNHEEGADKANIATKKNTKTQDSSSKNLLLDDDHMDSSNKSSEVTMDSN